jgi:hypothetical protein
MRIGNVTYLPEDPTEGATWHSYIIVVSGAGESPRLEGYGVGSAVAATTDTPEMNPGHLLLKDADDEQVLDELLRTLRAIPGNQGREVVAVRSR